MNTPVESIPSPIARRICRGGVRVTSTVETHLYLTDSEARDLIDQLRVALAEPAPPEAETEEDATQRMQAHQRELARQDEARQALRNEVVIRSRIAFAAGVREPSIVDLLTLPGRPLPIAILRAAGREDLIAAIASCPTPAPTCAGAAPAPAGADALR